MTTDLAGYATVARRYGKQVVDTPRVVRSDLGRMGQGKLLDLEGDVFGSDRRFSGAKRSRNARRPAGARFRNVDAGSVAVFPTGDPPYIFLRGRGGGKRIYPRKRSGYKAVGGPGGPRRYAIVGRLAPRPNLLDPAIRKMADEAPRVVLDGVRKQLR